METLQRETATEVINPKLRLLNELLQRVRYGDIIPDIRETLSPKDVGIEGLQMVIRINDSNLADAPVRLQSGL